MNLNKAELIGNLVADPIVKALPSGQSIASFRMATNYTWRDSKTKEKKNNTEYHPIIAWGKLGDVVGKYLNWRHPGNGYLKMEFFDQPFHLEKGHFQNSRGKSIAYSLNLVMAEKSFTDDVEHVIQGFNLHPYMAGLL